MYKYLRNAYIENYVSTIRPEYKLENLHKI